MVSTPLLSDDGNPWNILTFWHQGQRWWKNWCSQIWSRINQVMSRSHFRYPRVFISALGSSLAIFRNDDFSWFSSRFLGGECFAPPPSTRGSSPSVSKFWSPHRFWARKFSLKKSLLSLSWWLISWKNNVPRNNLGSLRWCLGIVRNAHNW